MAKASVTCPRCDEAMEVGYVTRSWVNTPLQPFVWVPGRPAVPANLGVGTKRKKPLVITSWRCGSCGRLESFAT